jgi:adenine-specific DNA-methyltransferase
MAKKKAAKKGTRKKSTKKRTPTEKRTSSGREVASTNGDAAVPWAMLEERARRSAAAGDASRRWGPDNPHPLSTMKTELVWEGKYDEWGNRREVDVAGCAMPMQRIETIDQPRSEAVAAGQLSIFEKKTTRVDDFRNRLIWGDNKLVMASLLVEFKGKIDLIYIDPPFDVGADFTMTVGLGEEGKIKKEQSALEMVAYRDTWGNGTDSYLSMMYERISVLADLLSDTGNFYIHVDSRVVHYLRVVCEDIFGPRTLRNEIIWCYRGGGTPNRAFAEKHDTILRYSKTKTPYFDVDSVRIPYSEASAERMEHQTNVFRGEKVYRDYERNAGGKHPEDWWPIQPIMPSEKMERVGYPTQKPVELLQRIVDSSCPPDGLVLDAFCGSGSTLAVAEGLRVGRNPAKKAGSDKYLYYADPRRWIGCDLGRFAIHTARKRLIDVQRTLSTEGKPYRSFDVHNLGRYERQWWQQEALKGADTEHRRVVLEFFKAEILDPAKSSSPLIHGRKGRALCHVDGIDSIFTAAEARAVAQAAVGMGAREIYCLAWDFEMDIRQRMAAIEAETGIKTYPVKIPREIMEQNRTSPPPWLEVAVLEAESVYRNRSKAGKRGPTRVDIKLTRFLPSLAEVPTKELESIRDRAIKSGFDFIDFWAVDFDWHEDRPFNHHWQDYRTRKDRSLKSMSEAGHDYAKAGKYTACVKVVDVFGCDTSITVPVKV